MTDPTPRTPDQTTVLVVEDSPTQLEKLRFLLEEAGFRVVAATNGVEGLAAARANAVDLVISDIVMPEMDGYALCKALRADARLGHVPVILLTSLNDPKDVIRGLEAGANNFICKPYDDRALLARVQNVIANLEIRKGATSEMGINILFSGQRFFVTADRLQILDLLLSTYENAVANNGELIAARDGLRVLNEQLETRVVERTSALTAEIEERKRAELRIHHLNRLLRTITQVNELLVRATDEETLLTGVCEILVSGGGYALVWIGRAEPETKRVMPVAKAGAAVEVLSAIEIRLDDASENLDPLAVAIRERRTHIVTDVRNEPAIAPYREILLRHGISSIAALPIARGGAVPSALGVYAAKVGFIDKEEVTLLEELAADVSFSLNALDDREHVRKSDLETRKLWRAVEQSPSIVVITNVEGTIEYVNPRFTEVTGYTAKEALGQNPRILKSGRTLPEVYRALWEELAAGRTWHGEFANRKKDGALYWESASISPVRDTEGRTTHYVAVKEDITDAKRAGEALARSEAYFRSIIENALDVIAVLDIEGVVLYVSPSLEKTLGYRPDDLRGRSVFELVHPEDRRKAESELRAIALEGAARKLEARVSRRDGTWRTFSILGNRLPAEAEMPGIVINARDLTERLQLEAQFRQSQKMEAVGQLAGGVAHDFNNLLTAILGYSDLLISEVPENDPKYEEIIEIRKAGERAAALTRQLLAFSRRQVLHPQVLNVNAVLVEIEKMLRRVIGEEISFNASFAGDLGNVKVDPGQIEQVVLNLTINARDAMPHGGELTIETSNVDLDETNAMARAVVRPGPYVMISVSDTGTGMDAETKSRVFEPFFTTKEPGKGTGLGLATAYGIIKQSDGYIWVYSEPGQGTTFKIYLPRVEENVEMRKDAAASSYMKVGSETILLVEDEEGVRRLVRSVLEKQGYTVIEAPGGEAALEIVERHDGPLHLVLTDVVMAGMGGPELSRRFADVRPEARFLFMSGYADALARHGALSPSAPFLAKPFTRDSLLRKVREVLDAASPANDRVRPGPSSAP